MTKTILFIDAAKENCVPKKMISCISDCNEYAFHSHKYETKEGLIKFISEFSSNIDVLYIGAHGNKDGIAFQAEGVLNPEVIGWFELADIICQTDKLTPNSTIYLGCCEGGFKRTALILMYMCGKVDTIAALPCKLYLDNAALAFHVFLNQLQKNSDSAHIAKAVSAAIDQQFNIFIRQDIDTEIYLFSKMIEEPSNEPKPEEVPQ